MDSRGAFRTKATDELGKYRGLIFDTLLKLHAKYGGDFDELVSDGYFYFLEALQTYDASKSKFTTWLVHKITFLFLAKRKAYAIERARRGEAYLDGLPGKAPRTFDTDSFCRLLGPAGKLAVTTVVAMPKAFQYEAESRGGEPRNFLSALRTVLANNGYKHKDITEAFNEVKEALCEA